MSQLSGTSGGIPTDVKYRLGDLGDLARQQSTEGITEIDDLIAYLNKTDAQVEYGDKILSTLDQVLAEIRGRGINQDTFVAVESIRPGTIPAAVRSVLTSNFSRVHREETVVALESYAQVGKYGILLLLVGAVIKILSWIVKNSTAAGGGNGQAGDDYKGDADGRVDGASMDGETILGSLKTTVVKDGYVTAFPSAKDPKSQKEVNDVAAILDARIAEAGAEDYFNSLSAVVTGGKSFVAPILAKAAKGEVSQREALIELITQVVACGAPSAIFSDRAAQAAWGVLPKPAKEAGVRYATGSLFKRYTNALTNLNGDAGRFEGFLNDVTSKLLRPEQVAQSIPASMALEFVTIVSTLSATVFSMLERDASGNPAATTELASIGFRIKPEFAKNLIGYTEATGTTGSYEFRYVTSGAFMCTELLVDLLNNSGISDNDHPAILKSLTMLGPKELESNPKTDIAKYSALLKRFEALYDDYDDIGKLMQKKLKEMPHFKQFEDNIYEAISGNKQTAAIGKDTGLYEIGAASDEPGSSFFKGSKAVLAVCRDFAKTGGALTKVVDRHNKSPWVRSIKK